ncbi:uncharacterized protein [Macrobrachium rosenbergii]|uniref:uncharacterized protein n=1 Tax=Macrobrachium rosenbergii TaxID=79674 RepID=UPI0034D6A8F5
MADLRQCSREFLTEFIALYESFPCIWRVKSKDYSDRDKKGKAYESLMEKFKEIDKNANRDMVVKNINSLRSVYRKELAKVNDSNRSGAGEEEIYKPSLWYFDLLHFLNDHETSRHSRNTMDEIQETAVDEPPEQAEEDVHEDATDSERSEATATPISEESSGHSSKVLSRNSSRSNSSVRKRKGVPNEDDTAEVMRLVGRRLESLQADDAFMVFGMHVANKLRGVARSQNAIAQKLISDVLFEAELGALTRNFKIVDITSQRQDNFGFVNERNWCQQNMPQQFRMPHTLPSTVAQYHSIL